MIAGLSVERSRIADAVRALRGRLRPGATLRLRSPAGSDLEVHLPTDVRWTEHNAPVRIGRAEPLPAASVTSYVARIRGTFVADASAGSALGAQIGSLASSPVRLEIDGGMCRSIRCKDGALERALDAILRSEPLVQRVGSIHLGAHVGLLDATGEIGCDLTLPGLHLVLGTRTTQDGAPFTTRTEIGFAGRSADVDVDGVPLVRAGRVLSP
jgi:leucyl aminopeptidase (aminopeptidase T)